jgi:enoyl-CoA hydratase
MDQCFFCCDKFQTVFATETFFTNATNFSSFPCFIAIWMLGPMCHEWTKSIDSHWCRITVSIYFLIGLFPDVGGGWYLSRLEGRVGQFLALTGARIAGAGCLSLGLATHYLTSNVLAEAKSRIATEDVERIDGILGTLSVTPPDSKIVETIVQINRHFAFDRLEHILASLEGDESDWAMKELATLRSKSPQTCKVALRQLAESLKLTDFADNMAMEYRIASRVLVRPDFAEGVRAVIVDKDNSPKWDPATAEGVTDALIDAIFAPLPAQQEWKPL